ncbi:MAG TPA: group III truncated hemoglobin [Saprospiraceae bacterium]|nr:group III truncated hemoglobin [Saprospiraceae bacterium]HMU03908.1 group III truncated hemoglobin [Saprospiraceae bacterium]
MRDIENRQDIEIVVNSFYDKVRQDDMIGFMFDHVDWQKHLPVMYDFWDNVLFYTGNYTGNPMAKHQMANARYPMTAAHFERWLSLFYVSVEELFTGEKTTLLKERAKSIASIMQLKIIGNDIPQLGRDI